MSGDDEMARRPRRAAASQKATEAATTYRILVEVGPHETGPPGPTDLDGGVRPPETV